MPGTITNLGQTLGGAVMGKPPKLPKLPTLPKVGGFKPISIPKPPAQPTPVVAGGHSFSPVENPAPVVQPSATLGQMAPDPWTAALADPRNVAAQPGYAARRNDLYAQYGWIPDASSATGYRVAGVAEQPYSIANQLAQALRQESQNVMNTHNARGLLFSGSQVQGQEQALDAHNRGMAERFAEFVRNLGEVASDEAALQSSIYSDAIARPAPDVEMETRTPAPVVAATKPVTKPTVKPKAKPKPKAKAKKGTTGTITTGKNTLGPGPALPDFLRGN